MLSNSFLKDVEIIQADVNSGAVKIAQDCLIALKKECLASRSKINESFLKKAIQQLLDTHPMATIGNALFPIYIRLVQLINEGNLKKIDYKPSIEMLFATRKEHLRLGEKNTQETLTEALKGYNSILTFSHSSTVNIALSNLAKAGFIDKKIFILESRPLNEGNQTVHSLIKAGFENVSIGIDFALNEFAKEAEVAVLGADTIHANGQIINKLGSTTIAKIFHSFEKEVIIAASLSKICLRGMIQKNWFPSLSVYNCTPGWVV